MSKLVPLTLDKAKTLQYGDIIYEKGKYNSNGSNRRWRVTGKVKVWKRDSTRVRVPIKHGLYDYGAITEGNIDSALIEE